MGNALALISFKNDVFLFTFLNEIICDRTGLELTCIFVISSVIKVWQKFKQIIAFTDFENALKINLTIVNDNSWFLTVTKNLAFVNFNFWRALVSKYHIL